MSLKLAFYGDDFTGSTHALEVLAFAGLRQGGQMGDIDFFQTARLGRA